MQTIHDLMVEELRKTAEKILEPVLRKETPEERDERVEKKYKKLGKAIGGLLGSGSALYERMRSRELRGQKPLTGGRTGVLGTASAVSGGGLLGSYLGGTAGKYVGRILSSGRKANVRRLATSRSM